MDKSQRRTVADAAKPIRKMEFSVRTICSLGKKRGWERMMEALADDPDMENGIIDSTIVRAHPCAAGAPKKVRNKL